MMLSACCNEHEMTGCLLIATDCIKPLFAVHIGIVFDQDLGEQAYLMSLTLLMECFIYCLIVELTVSGRSGRKQVQRWTVVYGKLASCLLCMFYGKDLEEQDNDVRSVTYC